MTRELKYGKVRVVLSEDVHPETFLAGFHGVGHVGWIAVKHVVEKLEAQRVGYLFTQYMPPFVNVRSGIRTPYELYFSQGMLIFLPNVPVSPKDFISVPEALAELSITLGVKLSVLFGGLDASYKEPDAKPRIAPTRAFLLSKEDLIKEKGYPVLEEHLGIVGPLAILLSVFEANNVPAVAILPYAAADRPDPRAAAEAIKVFQEITGVRISVEELLEQGERLEKEVAEVEKKIKEAMREREPPMYHV
ncbi:proteasome assembly chaperone family protein [Thermofilum pendens]|uniref:Proteasome assembly chaperone family protein n=1 Tax=Thermofilum pendens (strain DSM 2475 / Hrk 5) TaxID=368408 RepID=A1RX36_THEPD|nr:PAC2 family protein [Thermofilum pendens]ABL77766.1 protein of unknown function DUF75 [Thermofilum pendens Hrk 5]